LQLIFSSLFENRIPLSRIKICHWSNIFSMACCLPQLLVDVRQASSLGLRDNQKNSMLIPFLSPFNLFPEKLYQVWKMFMIPNQPVSI
jgi:hypothetical protein